MRGGQDMRKRNGFFKLTPAAEIRRAAEGVPVELPSGHRVRIRSVDAGMLLTLGYVPDTLYAFLEAQLAATFSGRAITAETIREQMTYIEFLKKDRALAEAFASAALVYPRVARDKRREDLDEDEILVTDLSYDDLVAIRDAVQLPAKALEKFREQPLRPVGAVPAAGEDGAGGERDTEAA